MLLFIGVLYIMIFCEKQLIIIAASSNALTASLQLLRGLIFIWMIKWMALFLKVIENLMSLYRQLLSLERIKLV